MDSPWNMIFLSNISTKLRSNMEKAMNKIDYGSDKMKVCANTWFFFLSSCDVEKWATHIYNIMYVWPQRQCHIFPLSQADSFTKTVFICSSLWLKLWFICGFRYLNVSVQHQSTINTWDYRIYASTHAVTLPKVHLRAVMCGSLMLLTLFNMIYPNWSINSSAFTTESV